MVGLSQSSEIQMADGNAQSFLVGWINLAGWLTLVTTEAMFGGNDFDPIIKLKNDRLTFPAQFIAAAVVAGSNYTIQLTAWHTYLYFIAISCFAICLNIFGYRFLGKWNEGARKTNHNTRKRLHHPI